MGKIRRINIQGKKNKIYDLDKIGTSNTRNDETKPFVIYIKRYNPTSKIDSIKSPIPADVKIGSMWLARKDISLVFESDVAEE